MLNYALDPRAEAPLYEQLCRAIRRDIHQGLLPSGTRLPSRRSLAAGLGVSAITVDGAYSQLLSEGYLRAEPRRGYFVSDGFGDPVPAEDRPSAERGAEELRADAVLPRGAEEPRGEAAVPHERDELRGEAGLPREEDELRGEAALPKDAAAPRSEAAPLIADLTSNETPPGQFPFTVWSRIIRQLLADDQARLLRNPPAGGRLDLREAIAGHLRGFRGLNVDPEQIVVGAGTEYLYGLLVQLLGAASPWAVEEPGYQKAALVYRSHGARCIPIPLDDEGLRADLLAASGAEVVHVTPSHHFPTGRVMSAARRQELLRWASAGSGRFIIEDDYDSEFRLAGRPIPALQSLDAGGRVIYLNTFTKTLASTIRVSYMVLPPRLLQRYRERLSFYACTVSSIEQATLARFISQGSFQRHLDRTRTAFRRKRALLLKGLRERLPEGLATVSGEDAGLHFLLTLAVDRSDAEVLAAFARHGLRVAALSGSYHADPAPEHVFVIHDSSVREEDVPRVCEAMADAIIEAAG